MREQARSGGKTTLDATANTQIAAMLSVSDNHAADALWNRYAAADPAAWMTRFHGFGMTTATYVDTVSRSGGAS